MDKFKKALLTLAILVGLTFVAKAAVVFVSLTSPSTLGVGSVTCELQFANSDMTCRLQYQVTATGSTLDTHTMYIPGNNGPILDMSNNGLQMAASVPTAVSTARDNLLSAVQSALSTAAAAGKLNR